MAKPTIIISQQDLQRLETMLEHQSKLSPTMQHLEDELARADVVAPQDVANRHHRQVGWQVARNKNNHRRGFC